MVTRRQEMSASLFGERFLDARRPAWHNLGVVLDGKEKVTATDAYSRLGTYVVRLAPVTADGVSLNQQAILRDATPDDDEIRVFGVTGPEYHLITPDDICTIWDERVGVPVETVGALGLGETFFVSTFLPTLDVKGDEVENYLTVANPMTGTKAADVFVSPVRTVCANTLAAGLISAVERFRITHDRYAKQRMGDWLQLAYEEAETTAKMLNEAFKILASTKVSEDAAKGIFDDAYPHPNRPARNAPPETMELRNKWFDENVSLMNRRRDGAFELFSGKGTGMDSKAAKGTAWGAYNAVVETEDYRTGRDEQQIAESSMFGERMKHKKKAFEASMEYAKR
jgi:phage/plasmid-like protein (TIGR03299 family)